MEKTQEQADAFAATLEDAGEKEIFLQKFAESNVEFLKGHFPKFFE